MTNIVRRINRSQMCTGCGVCESLGKCRVCINSKGKFFVRDQGMLATDNEKMRKLCPAFNTKTSDNFWGDYNSCGFSHSNDPTIRFEASSGGTITQILIYLLEYDLVDAVLHVGENEKKPLYSCGRISRTVKDVLKNEGSRYAPAKLLSKIQTVLDKYKRIAIVGKPCDLRAVDSFVKCNERYKGRTIYKLSVFCGGVPSQQATRTLMNRLDINESDVKRIRYRGRGWPGRTTVYLKNGTKKSMDYNESWGEILGRDLHRMCKFCVDGIGESADISCGDGWYSTQNGYPDFSEKDGRNIILCRTRAGKEIIERMKQLSLLSIEPVECVDDYLNKIQVGQYFRKSSMWGKAIAAKICCLRIPLPRMKTLWKWRQGRTLYSDLRVAVGTIKRLLRNTL